MPEPKTVDYDKLALPDVIPRSHWRWYIHTSLRQEIPRALEAAGLRSGLRVLDIGCGARPHERPVRAQGAEYEGADVPENTRADHAVGPHGILPLSDGRYDIVLSTQVLEHVPDPRAFLSEARRVLRPGGRLVISTHGMWVYHPSPTDFWRWTHEGLRKQIADAGFRIVDSWGLVGLLAAGLHFVQDHLYRMTKRVWLRNLIARVMQTLIATADRRLHTRAQRSRDAMIYIVVAERIEPA